MNVATQIDITDDISKVTLNVRRAAWGQIALEAFANVTGLNLAPDADGVQSALTDLQTALRHFAAAHGIDFNDLNELSADRYDGDVEEEAQERQEQSITEPITPALIQQAVAQEQKAS